MRGESVKIRYIRDALIDKVYCGDCGRPFTDDNKHEFSLSWDVDTEETDLDLMVHIWCIDCDHVGTHILLNNPLLREVI